VHQTFFGEVSREEVPKQKSCAAPGFLKPFFYGKTVTKQLQKVGLKV
jgi:hypothetical protein